MSTKILPPPDPGALKEKWKGVLEKTFDVWSWTSCGELLLLAHLASHSKRIVEVGSYHGKSAKVMNLANPSASILCIDQPESDRCWDILSANLRGTGVQIFRGTTGDWLRSLRPGGFDFAFIDGGHLFDDVSGDIANLLPHMAPGAILSGHDWRTDMNDGVNRGVLAHFKLEQLRFFESIWYTKLP